MENHQTLPTNRGFLSPEEIISSLTYQCYAHNRSLGMTHEGAERIGLSREGFREVYEASITIVHS